MNDSSNSINGTVAEFPFDGTDAEKLEFLVRYAVLAPSKYNIQPWVFDICSNSVDVICERHGVLQVADPDNRELIMSCGAALLNLRVAAAYFGYDTDVRPFPSPAHPHVTARVALREQPVCEGNTPRVSKNLAGKARDNLTVANKDLFHALLVRSTYRAKFGAGVPNERVLASCRAAALRNGAWLYTTRNKWIHRKIACLVARADREHMANKSFRQELAMWIRGAKDKDGIRASALGLPEKLNCLTPGISFLVYLANMGRLLAARDRRLAEASPILAVLGTATDTPEAWLAAGQALEAVLLHAAAVGVSGSFLNRPVEINHLRTDLLHLTGGTGFPQAVLRLGYGQPGPPTPRRPLEQVVINTVERKSNMRILKNRTTAIKEAAETTETSPIPTQASTHCQPPAQSGLQHVAIHRTFLNAKSVLIAGTFNNWKPSAAEVNRCGRDSWRADLLLKPGRYEYRFVVDEKWTDDPVAHNQVPNPFGGHNSILVVAAPNDKSKTVKIPAPAALNEETKNGRRHAAKSVRLPAVRLL